MLAEISAAGVTALTSAVERRGYASPACCIEDGCAMYTIELVRGLGWDAPIIEVHSVRSGFHICDVERMAQAFLNRARSGPVRLNPTNYRVVDALGRCVRSDAGAKHRLSLTRSAGRTAWFGTGGAAAR
jgi:hypothetical protein